MQREHDEPAGEGAAGVGQPGQFVCEDQEPGRQASSPARQELPVDGDAVLAADAEQAFGDHVLVGTAAKPRIGNDGELLPHERGETEVGGEAGQRWRADVRGSE